MIEITLGSIGWDAIAAVSGVLIATFGFAINKRLRRQEELTKRYALLGEYRQEIMGFSKEFFETVSEALALRARTDDPSPPTAELDRISTRLSSLVDTGRFLFPNHIPRGSAYGAKKGPAFAGFRRPPLDAILAAHFAVEAMRRSGDGAKRYLEDSIRHLKRTRQPLTEPVRDSDPVYLLIQSRRCYLNAVVPDTFPQEWLSMFSDLLGPVKRDASEEGESK